MASVNCWISLSDTAKATLAPLLDDMDYDGQHLTAVKIFRKMIDRDVVQQMFRPGVFNSKTWTLYSVYLPASQQAAAAIQHLTDNYPANFVVVGAWHWDGRQVGTQWVLDEDGQRVQENIGTEEEPIWRDQVTGTPTYAIPKAALLKIMPQDVDWSDPENPVYSEPTALRDVNLLAGQAKRRFD